LPDPYAAATAVQRDARSEWWREARTRPELPATNAACPAPMAAMFFKTAVLPDQAQTVKAWLSASEI